MTIEEFDRLERWVDAKIAWEQVKDRPALSFDYARDMAEHELKMATEAVKELLKESK